jgi:hypothetical protein
MQTYTAVFTIQSILYKFLQGLCIVRDVDRISTKSSKQFIVLHSQCICVLLLRFRFYNIKKKTPFHVARIIF